MTGEKFLRILGDIDSDLITEAEELPVRRPMRWIRAAGAAAACLVLIAGILLILPRVAVTQDNAAEAAPEAADKHILFDAAEKAEEDYHYSLSVSGDKNAENGTVAENDAIQTETLREWTFFYCGGKGWSAEVKTYPGGVPSLQTVLNDYLASAKTNVRCTGVRAEVSGSKDEILPGGAVQHTAGVRTVYVTLDGDPGENVLMGLVNTALNSRTGSTLYQVQITTPSRTFGPRSAYEY